ncbi:hypothetical protein DPMN_003617 [Dreissena polymorpha]|uniref:Uncharacterized protein n=1 Tax=Dreissena polymorpha TaxID=45954 RepID=A0A9D4MNR3_DREPO|nr:hypothetical protein DPMN_003617 [Dreissena polymorpha]
MRPSALQPKFFGSGHPSSLAQLVSRLGLLGPWVSVVGWPYGNQCRMDAFYLAHFFGENIYDFVGSADGRHPESALIYNLFVQLVICS